MNTEILYKLWANNFTTNKSGVIYRCSKRNGITKKVGQINEAGVYFFAQNVHPFKNGQNTTRDILGDNVLAYNPKPYVKAIKLKELSYDFTFEQYLETTKGDNHLGRFLAPHVQTLTNTESNLYDLRGVKSGYLEDATLFPYINFDNEFITAKIVKYNSVSGKRSKGEYSNNWYHAYKPIKSELGITDKISKKVNCFFGEHLLRYNDKPVVIVESEKTAIFLSLLYDNIVFIASGGLSNLERLKHDFLRNREVYVFPDNGAEEWFKIAEMRNWWSSNIIEDEGAKGSDIVDYFDTEIGEKLNIELTRIARGDLHYSSAKLNFRLKKKQSKRYCLPTFNELNLIKYWDNAEGRAFKGKNFNIYNSKFDVLSGNIDFNKWQEIPTEFTNSEGLKVKYLKKMPLDASELLNRLEKCFRIIKYLNPNQDHQKLFTEMIGDLLENSNYLFNERHVIEELLPVWDNGENDIEKYYKRRSWRFVSKEEVEDTEFLTLLSNDKKAFQTHTLLIQLKPLLNSFQYIQVNDFGLKTKRDNSLVWGLIKQYNSEVIGCKTINQFHKKLELQEYFDFIEERASFLGNNQGGFQKCGTPYNNPYIECHKSGTVLKQPSIQVIFDNTLIDKKTIREFINFDTDEAFLLDLKVTVQFLLDNPNNLHFERLNRRIEVSSLDSIEYMTKEVLRSLERTPEIIKTITPTEAFSDDLDLSGSVLHCDEEEAITRGGKFLFSWTLFNYPEMTNIERAYLQTDLCY